MSDGSPNQVAFKFAQGERVRDTVTGYEGTVTGRFEYMNGRIRYAVEARVEKPNDEPKSSVIDEDQLEWIDAIDLKREREAAQAERPGGPRPAPRRTGH